MFQPKSERILEVSLSKKSESEAVSCLQAESSLLRSGFSGSFMMMIR